MRGSYSWCCGCFGSRRPLESLEVPGQFLSSNSALKVHHRSHRSRRHVSSEIWLLKLQAVPPAAHNIGMERLTTTKARDSNIPVPASSGTCVAHVLHVVPQSLVIHTARMVVVVLVLVTDVRYLIKLVRKGGNLSRRGGRFKGRPWLMSVEVNML